MNLAVQLRNFSYIYPDGTSALRDINLEVEYGQKVVLVGPNGGGKTTLLQAIAGFIRGRGDVTVDGLEICSRNLRQIRLALGCCMENPDDQLFMPTLYEDVAFGPLNMNIDPQQVRTNVDMALQQVGLAELAEKSPHYLSAGQRRAAAIATVLSMSPKIITFDEPDGSLDPRSRKKLEKLLHSLPQTLIIATCNMRFAAAAARRVIVLDGGCIVADGPVEKILYDEELMASHGLEMP